MGATLIILTLNEREGVEKMLPLIPSGAVEEILCVDGGSTDGTIEFLREKGVRVVGQPRRGRGEAFRVAVREARHDVLVMFSPDGNEDPADVPRLRAAVESGADLAIASRMMKGAFNEEDTEFLKWRKWANQTFTLIANALYNRRGPYITDTINGYRAFKKATFEALNPDGEGYTIEYQMSIRAMKKRLNIVEIPTHEGQRYGYSKAGSIPTGLRMLKLLSREMWGG